MLKTEGNLGSVRVASPMPDSVSSCITASSLENSRLVILEFPKSTGAFTYGKVEEPWASVEHGAVLVVVDECYVLQLWGIVKWYVNPCQFQVHLSQRSHTLNVDLQSVILWVTNCH